MTATSCKGLIFFIVDADGMISDKNIVFVDYIWMKSSILKKISLIINHNTMKCLKSLITSLLLMLSLPVFAQPVIYINQVGFDSRGPKIAVIGSDASLS